MPMRSIVTFVRDPDTERNLIAASGAIAEANDGHLSVFCLGIDRVNPGIYYAGSTAMDLKHSLETARQDALDAREKVEEQLKTLLVGWDTLAIVAQIGALTGEVAARAALADLIVLPKPYGPSRSNEDVVILETALFETAVPVLVLPDGHSGAVVPERVVLAWNESKEALAAARAALPMLVRAKEVNLVVIDPPSHGSDRSDPGGALAAMLARHGASVSIDILPRTMGRVADVLVRHVNEKNADLVVMGAYGHSRLREAILGGATRDMLEAAHLPVLMAH